MIEAAVGYAAGPRGEGIAYALLSASGKQRLIRLTFRVPDAAGFIDRASGYAALTTLAETLRARGLARVRFLLGDAALVAEINQRKVLADALVLPYVRLHCALNALSSYSVRVQTTDDLTQRARAEAALNLAA
jgi:hypothetical protein